MSSDEIKSEEREVLLSIYDGDNNFKQISDDVYQYKIENSGGRSFLLEIKWTESYPSCIPEINLDAFYNNKIPKDAKDTISKKIAEEAEQYLDMSMTYSLFEWAKENADSLMEDFKEENPVNDISARLNATTIEDTDNQKKPKEKKEQLTKAQKRKMINRCDQSGQLPRGWNWIDVIKHLSQVGSKDQQSNVPTS